VDGVLKDNYLPDGGRLYLITTAKGGKLWRYHFSFQNKKYRLPLGKYPIRINLTKKLIKIINIS